MAAGDEEPLNISPIARQLAEDYGVDTSVLRGTGPGGQITHDDVLQVVQGARPMPAGSVPEEAIVAPALTSASVEAPHAPAGVSGSPLEILQAIPLSGMRGQVAERRFESENTIPRMTEVMQIDMSATVACREARLGQWEQQYGFRISLNDMITKAVAVALSRHPRLNATLVDQVVRVHRQVNIGVAVHLDSGSIVPVVKDAGQKGLGEIGRERRELAEKARASLLQVDDLSEGTFTLANLGTTGIDLFTPMINPPQVAVLGVGRVQRRPVVVEDALAVRPSAYFCLVFDHRVVDALPAASFLQELQQLLMNPQDYAL